MTRSPRAPLIGDPEQTDEDPWISAAESRVREVQGEYLRGLGIPEDWLDHCMVMGWKVAPDGRRLPVPGSEIVFRVGSPNPPRSVDDLLEAVRLGLSLSIQPQRDLDLASIDTVVAAVRSISIGGLHPARGWDVFAASPVERLFVGGAADPLPPMHALSRFSGMGGNSLGVLASPLLNYFDVDLMGDEWRAGIQVVGPLETLCIMGARRVARLPELRQPDALRTVKVDGARDLDISSLSGATGLEWISLSRAHTIRGGDTVGRLASLQRLDLRGVHEWEGWERLGDSSIPVVTFEQNHLVPDEVAARWMAEHPAWRIQPMRRARR